MGLRGCSRWRGSGWGSRVWGSSCAQAWGLCLQSGLLPRVSSHDPQSKSGRTLCVHARTYLASNIPPSMAAPPYVHIIFFGRVLATVTHIQILQGADHCVSESPSFPAERSSPHQYKTNYPRFGCLALEGFSSIIAAILTLCLSMAIFNAMAEAERTLQQRLAYAKVGCCTAAHHTTTPLTSAYSPLGLPPSD